MPRSLILGNGNMLVCFDRDYRMRDFYYPHVGLENHIGNYSHRTGVWVDGRFSWIGKEEWELDIRFEKSTLVSQVVALNRNFQIEIVMNDTVYNETNIFVRRLSVRNLREDSREPRLFFSQEFPIYEVQHGNTAYYDPRQRVLIHYKGQRVFLINGQFQGNSFKKYTCGTCHWKGKEGSFRDAEDGELEKNSIEHGSVDSVIQFDIKLRGKQIQTLHYWIAVGNTLNEVKEMNEYVIKKTPAHLIKTTRDFWHAWVEKQGYHFFDLSSSVVELFKRSLFYCRVLTDNKGASIASPDSDILQFGKDTYAYMWPRDAAFNVLALDEAGYHQINRRFFELCGRLITEEGFLMHKYHADGALGSSWHAWVSDYGMQYPIQEDETALVIFALEQHYEKAQTVEFVERLYNPLIKKAADFMADYRDPKTKLPGPSYDIWEERMGVHAFTSCLVYVALLAAASLSRLLGKRTLTQKYDLAAQEVRKAIHKHFYDPKLGYYIRRLYQDSKRNWVQDQTLDMSTFYGLMRFGLLSIHSRKLGDMAEKVKQRLMPHSSIRGIARYEKDPYMAVSQDWNQVPGNPWIICTLWLADYYTARAVTVKDLEESRQLLERVSGWALASGGLSEQIHPYTGEHLSVSPLTWSHSQYVISILFYLKKMSKLTHQPFKKGFRLTGI